MAADSREVRGHVYVCLTIFWVLFCRLVNGNDVTNFAEFYFVLEPSDVVVSRGDPAYLHCTVKSGGVTPTINWLKDDQVLDLRGDSVRSILPNGTLYISQIQNRDKGSYRCHATIPQLGTISSRKVRLKTAYLSRNFLIQPQDLNIYLQDVAMFQCRGDGLPSPNVTWYKYSDRLQESASNIRIYTDGVLEINPVKFSDFGTYYCEVENIERTRSSRIAKLTQNANTDSRKEGIVPNFVMRPSNTEVPEGASTILFCGANGKDHLGKRPTITWLKDGLTINFRSTQGRLKMTGSGSLQIFNVKQSDSGTYSCRPSNMEDSIDSDATLSVLAPPKFKVKPQNIVADKNSDIAFHCEVDGIPKPKTFWTKNGQPIRGSDYIIVEDTELRILGILPSDVGFYQCHAYNDIGSVQAIAQLQAIDTAILLPFTPSPSQSYQLLGAYRGEMANLPSEPKSLTGAIVSKRFVTLKWEMPDNAGRSPITTFSVFWKEQGSQRERMLNTTQNEANIQHLKPNTNYQFKVISYNSYGPSPKSAKLTIHTEKDVAVPSPAINAQAIPLTPHSIQVTWSPPRQTKGQITKYILIYYEVGANRERRTDIVGTTKDLTGLMAFREYSFRVIAVNGNGEGMSTEEFVAKTFSDKPSEAPQNFTLETASSTSLIVRWEPPPLDHQNGIITGYKIRYKKRGASRNGATVTTDGNRRLYALTNLEKNQEYQVRISALTVNGSGPLSPKLKATTYKDDLDESSVPPPPRRVRVTPHATSIRVSWSTPPPESKILVRGYVLGWGKGVPDEKKKVFEPDTQVYTIENLQPASEYVITVRAVNKKGDGNPRYQTATTTEETLHESVTPMMPPVGLKTIVLSSTTVVLTWSDTSLGTNQMVQDSRFYTVRYRVVSNNNNARHRYLNSTDLNAHIDNLKPNTRYEFEVKVIKGRRQSAWSMKEINKTEEAAPGSVPQDLTPIPKENDPRAVILNWQPPAKPNGLITGYLVFYTTNSKLDDRDWVVEGVVGGDELSKTIKRLTPDTTYYMKVQARNSKGYGPVSDTVIYKTPKADGSGGGQIDPIYPPGGGELPTNVDKIGSLLPSETEDPGGRDYNNGDSSEGGLPTGIMNIIIASVVGVAFCTVIVVVAIIYCRRRDNEERNKRQAQNQQSPAKGKGQGRDLKPPDLWIHDNMEMKNIDKGQRSESMLTMSTTRRSSNDYRSMDDLPPYNPDMERQLTSDMCYHPPSDQEERERFLPPRQQGSGLIRPKAQKPLMIPVDTQLPPREPVAMVTALPNGALTSMDRGDSQGMMPHSRPGFPRTQYNMQYTTGPRVNAGDVPQPPPMQAFHVDYAYKPPAYEDDDRSSLHSCLDDHSFSSRSIGYGRRSSDCHSPIHNPQIAIQKSTSCHSPNHCQPMAVIAPGQHEFDGQNSLPRGRNPLRSFTIPSPPIHNQPLSGGHHTTPKHQIVKPQQSPYKKAVTPISSVPIKPRAIPIIKPKAPDVVLKAGTDPDLQKSESTEELSAEMANLDCLMKDLNAITQQNFEV